MTALEEADICVVQGNIPKSHYEQASQGSYSNPSPAEL